MQTTFNKGDIVKSIDYKVVILLSEDGIYTPQPPGTHFSVLDTFGDVAIKVENIYGVSDIAYKGLFELVTTKKINPYEGFF